MIVILSTLCGMAFAADKPVASALKAGQICITSSASENETRGYMVNVTISGKMNNPYANHPMDIHSAMVFKVQNKYTKKSSKGLTPMEMTLLEGTVTMDGQKLTISPSIYPKLTVLLDKDFMISDIYGAGASSPGSLPGINYNNVSMLFHPIGLNVPRAVGDTWETKILLPSLQEAYQVKSELKPMPVNDANAVAITQNITRVPYSDAEKTVPAMSARVQSEFSKADGKLIKATVDCTIDTLAKTQTQPQIQAVPSTGQTISGSQAHVVMDISLVK